jgi:outer membrane immunogenic protein
MLKYAAFAAVALAGATPAFAADPASFSGGRVEAIVGWDHVTNNGLKDDGVAFGVAAGYDFELSGTILGIEGEVADATTKKFGIKAGRDLYIGGRIGVQVAPSTLAYAKLGYTNARVTCGSGCGTNLDGIRAGLGLEHQFASKVYVKGEYRYSNYQFGWARHQIVAGVGIRF